MIFGTSEESYSCDVDQVIVGLDQISTLDYQRANTPGISDPRRAKVRMATEQLKLHADRVFADGFFKAGVWTNEYTRRFHHPPTGKQFYQFDDANFDAVHFFGGLRTEMMRNGRRKPNVLALGVEAYEGLKRNPEILERVKYSGSTANPATINANVLAQLLEIDRVVVLNSTYNAGGYGTEDMQFICDSKGALLAYAAPRTRYRRSLRGLHARLGHAGQRPVSRFRPVGGRGRNPHRVYRGPYVLHTQEGLR